MSLERDSIIEAFLNQNGWAGAKHIFLAGDASFRRYDRILLSGKCAVLMDALPPDGDVHQFIAIVCVDFVVAANRSILLVNPNIHRGIPILATFGRYVLYQFGVLRIPSYSCPRTSSY